MAVDDDDRARFAVRHAVGAALFLVLEDLDRSGLLSAGHADCGDGAALVRTVAAAACVYDVIRIQVYARAASSGAFNGAMRGSTTAAMLVRYRGVRRGCCGSDR